MSPRIGRMAAGLEIWTVYDHPKDFPDLYVARLFINDTPTAKTMKNADLDAIRRQLRNKGFTRLPRQEADDPVIVECWL
jgi:hypothetical protein